MNHTCKRVVQYTLLLFSCLQISAQDIEVNLNNIEILRDKFGVPDIFAETDAESVYGLAWAQCEDNFAVMQENLAVIKNKSGILKGKDGAAMDFMYQFLEVEEFAREHYDRDISPRIDLLIKHYVKAVNRYAELHSDQILVKGTFPIDEVELLALYNFQFFLLTFGILDVAKVAQNKIDLKEGQAEFRSAGSNAMAYNKNITKDGNTYLIGNPHLPTEGPVNFWELGLHSKEGMNFHGVTFSGGGVTPVIGSNKNLGWTHTVNSEDYCDTYKLKMHPNEKLHYQYGDQWLPLEVKTAKLKVKFGPLIVPVKRKYYKSEYGPTLKNKSGYYAIRSNTFFNMKAIEQWNAMAKASNWEEFHEAMEIQGLPSQTITYADRAGNIFHISNGQIPYREESVDWLKAVETGDPKLKWSYDRMYPIEALPQVKNPKSGYLFNANNTPLDCTAAEENPKLDEFPKSFGILSTNTARANRFKELIAQYDQLNFQEARAIREDYGYHSKDLGFRQLLNLEDIFEVAEKFEDLADVSAQLKLWDRQMDIHNEPGSIIALASLYLGDYYLEELEVFENVASEELLADALRYAKKFLLKHYGSLNVELGTIQKVVCGDKVLPMFGSGQTLANCHPAKYKKGLLKSRHGDTFIMYAQYDEQGLIKLETINLFGNSRDPESPHFNDQMEMYVAQEVKEVSLDEAVIRANAVRSYHPE